MPVTLTTGQGVAGGKGEKLFLPMLHAGVVLGKHDEGNEVLSDKALDPSR